MLRMWNENMGQYLSPEYIICLNGFMSFWFNKYTCPGFMFVPHKSWKFGNEYHTIYCRLSCILFGLELVEG